MIQIILIPNQEIKQSDFELFEKIIKDTIFEGRVNIVENLNPTIIKEIDTNKWYWCKCENCGWEDSSEFTEGCHPIGDTGDHSDPICPICGCYKLEGEPTIEVPSMEGIIKVKLPLNLILEPYKKTIIDLNQSIDNLYTNYLKEIESL
jgi:hypothetical protein